MTFLELKNKFNTAKTKKDLLNGTLQELAMERESLDIRYGSMTKARSVFQMVAQKTQQNLEYHISKLVSMALSAVFPDPPEFVTKISIKRGKTECELLLKMGEDSYIKPIDSTGGGVLDVISFALRCSFWALKRNKALMILDEPFKFVSPDLQEKVSNMIQEVSNKLGLQIIMISHQEDVNVSADKTFKVMLLGKQSFVRGI